MPQREMHRANTVMERIQREDREGRRECASELRTFDAGTTRDGLGDAADEWPDYNDTTLTSEPLV